MSFGPTQNEKNAIGKQNQISDLSLANAGTATAAGSNLVSQGNQNVNAGTNFFQTLLNGNKANTTATLAPDINNIRTGNQANIQAASTLMPRGAGRSGTLFDMATAPGRSLVDLFTHARTMAPQFLASTGLAQSGQGNSFFGTGQAGLNSSGQMQGDLRDYEAQQRQAKNQFWSGLGGGIFNLATAPLGGFGSKSLLGRAGL